MEMTIDEIKRRLTDFLNYIPYDIEEGKKDCEAIEAALNMIKDYQTIKFNMITTLQNLKSEIKEMSHYTSQDGQDLVMVADIDQFIQQKINNLREGEL